MARRVSAARYAEERGQKLVSVELPVEMFDTVKHYAEAEHISVSHAIRRAVAEFHSLNEHTGLLLEG